MVVRIPQIPTETITKATRGNRLEARTEKEVSKAKGDIRRQLIAVPQKAMANSELSFRILTFMRTVKRLPA